MLDQSERLRAATWNAALAPLTIFEDPTIAAHTRTSDVALDALLDGTNPLSLYLCMGFHDIARLGVFLGALVEALVAVAGSPERPRVIKSCCAWMRWPIWLFLPIPRKCKISRE